MAFSQKNQIIQLTTPLGADVLLPQGIEGEEAISRPFHYSIEVISEQDVIDEKKIIGKPVTCSINLGAEGKRYFNGIVTRLAIGQLVEKKYRTFSLEVVPWFALMRYRSDCRIFQEMSVVDIIQSVFSELGFNDFQLKLQKSYQPREYCVQYRETDFDYVSRLMEEEGIFYYFKHEDGKHTMILCDYAKGYDKVPIDALDVSDGTHVDFNINSWQRSYRFCSGKVSHTDYSFEAPSTSLMTEQSTILSIPNTSKFDVYDYPGEYVEKGLGDGYARNRMEAIEAGHEFVEAGSNYALNTAGFVFKTGRNSYLADAKKGFVVTRIRHSATEGNYRAGGAGNYSYSNSFSCVPETVVMRPQHITPKPFIRGTQTAVVVGPAGEEIYTDKYGRIKVQFFWDRLGSKDENSSCWIRVAQIWSGKKWGAQYIPRIGQEVLISFLEGDPDRPLIIGSVYNSDQMPPYELPANRAHSGIKSRSTKGAGAENFNELRFEDEKGKELLYLHAEKDEQEVVENDQDVSIGNDQKIDVGNNQTIAVGKNTQENIGSNFTQVVGKNTSLSTGANHSEDIAEKMTLSVGGDRSTSIGKKHSITVADDKSETLGKNFKLDIAKDLNETVGGSHIEKIAKDFAMMAKAITLSADSFTIKVGKASLTMKKNGEITISGGKINVKGSGAVTVKGSKIDHN
ncbi:MAG: type VI secretion system tip protein VgrG [Hahellaceae bacterium]|nr:type VI secretion system tip protein VgrG [Hahellaceae bacterium]MCP5210454.1 type VI secretion system tip protein VgrG [Hahellaceae bacterium]